MDTATKNLLNSKYCNAVGFLTRLILIRLDGIGISPTPSKNGEANASGAKNGTLLKHCTPNCPESLFNWLLIGVELAPGSFITY
nr:hypothetical protein HAGR004_19230 [Bdellovibrio sp. HAGR004]